MADIANQVVHENNVQHIVQVFRCRIEDFELPDGLEDVDIIISEWMGFFLLHEGMLDSVIDARDRFLAADGLMLPSSATINVAPCAVPSRFDFWHMVQGVRMESVGRALNAAGSSRPEIMTVKPGDLLHDGSCMAWLDLRDVTHEQVEQLTFKEVIVVERPGRFQGVCIWFDCEFPIIETDSVILNTGPSQPETHWKQTVVLLPEQSHEIVEALDPIAFQLHMRRSTVNPRRYELELELLDQDVVEHPVPCNCVMTKCILIRTHLQRVQHEQQQRGPAAAVAAAPAAPNGHHHAANNGDVDDERM